MKRKFTVRAIGVLSNALTPRAIITATTGRGDKALTYVLLTFEERSRLADMAAEANMDLREWNRAWHEHAAPDLVRGYTIDAETGEGPEGRDPLERGARPYWSNCEDLWILAKPWADHLRAMQEAWIGRNPERLDGSRYGCPAKCWTAATALRMVFLAAGQMDLKPNVEKPAA